MRILGFQISRAKATEKALSPVSDRGWVRIMESFTGAWQTNVTVDVQTVLSNPVDFACRSLIASDISKLPLRLVAKDSGGVWIEVENPAYSPVLRRPNGYQNTSQFLECWMYSKLQRGNTYVLLRRDGARKVNEMHILDPQRVKPLVSDNGDVFYEINVDTLADIDEQIVVPASEIIHDRFNTFFHPLVGISPIFASGLASTQALAILNNSTRFFANSSRPGGILTAPGAISDETANRLRTSWEASFTGENVGRLAVVGDGLKYESIGMSAEEAQLVDQFKLTSVTICSSYGVPPYKVGIGEMPTYQNIQSLNVEYLARCIQKHLQDIEGCIEGALGIGPGIGTNGTTYGIDFDDANLLRMDSATQMDVLEKGRNYLTPNEGRYRINLPKTPGGDVVYRQQQDFSLDALAKRDAQADPFGTSKPEPAAPPANDNADAEADAQAAKALLTIHKGLS